MSGGGGAESRGQGAGGQEEHGANKFKQTNPQAIQAPGLITANSSIALSYFGSVLESQHTKYKIRTPPSSYREISFYFEP